MLKHVDYPVATSKQAGRATTKRDTGSCLFKFDPYNFRRGRDCDRYRYWGMTRHHIYICVSLSFSLVHRHIYLKFGSEFHSSARLLLPGCIHMICIYIERETQILSLFSCKSPQYRKHNDLACATVGNSSSGLAPLTCCSSAR